MPKRFVSTLLTACVAGFGLVAADAAAINVLYFSKSSGFQHSVVARDNDQPSHTERILSDLAEEHDVSLTNTKDGGYITAENLEDYDVVIFYTTGNLFEEGTDGQPPLTEEGLDALLEWVSNGGGFLGYHSATDTFHTPDGEEPNAYTQLVGGNFAGHGPQFEGTLYVVDSDHPTMANVPEVWTIHDEWYIFRNMNTENMRVLAMLETDDVAREAHDMYHIPDYPIIWTIQHGDGRVYHNTMGHREDVWENPTFQQTIVDAVTWAAGDGPAMNEPNYYEVVPTEADDE